MSRSPTLAEFITYAKAHPEKVTVGNAGLGSNAHLVCLYLLLRVLSRLLLSRLLLRAPPHWGRRSLVVWALRYA